MKPLFLTFSGINCYRDKIEIDFENLAEAGIFGIFGPTGSGKSTILDAMTLALYGEIPRHDRNTHSNFINSDMDNAEVTFTFEIFREGERRTFTAHRSYKREQKGGARITKCRLQADCGRFLADTERKMSAEVADLIGLNYQDFTRSVFLPQGKFAEFLFLKGHERGKMLERLFDLEYFGKSLKAKIKILDREVEKNLITCAAGINALGEASAKLITEFKESHAAATREIQALEKARDLYFAEREKYTALDAAWTQLNVSRAELELLEQKLGEINLEKQRLEAARRANNLRLPIEAHKNFQAQYFQAQKAKAVLGALYNNLRPEAEKYARLYEAARNARGSQEPALREQLYVLNGLLEVLPEVEAVESGRKSLLKRHKDLKEKLDRARTELVSFDKKEQDINEKLAILSRERDESLKNAAAAELARNLEPGGPCPVCGSRSHPDPVKPHGERLHDTLLYHETEIALKAEKEKASKALVSLNAEISRIEAHLESNIEAGRQNAESLAAMRAKLGEYQNEAKIALAQKGLQASLQTLVLKEKELEDLRDKYQREYQDASRALAAATAETEQGETLLKNHQSLIESGLKACGFETVAAAVGAVLTEEETAALEGKINQFWQKKAECESKVKQLSELLDDEEQPAKIPIKLQAARAKYAETDSALGAKREESAVLQRRIEDMAQKLELLKGLQRQKAEFEARHALIIEIEGLLRSNSFIRFLAARHLRYVVTSATKRLKAMTAGRYAIEFDDEANFLMRDDFAGGVHRPPATLSGGEAFMVSLCLALALSVKIQMKSNAELSFFFLDEGFGSLDNDTLGVVIDCLESLREESTVVGLITHVEELKNRIYKRIELKNTGG